MMFLVNKKNSVNDLPLPHSLSFFTIGSTVRGVSNEVLHDHALVILRAKEVLSIVIEVLKSVMGP